MEVAARACRRVLEICLPPRVGARKPRPRPRISVLGDARRAQHRGHGKQPATNAVGRQPHAFERIGAKGRAAYRLAENHERDHGSFGDPDPRLSDVKLDMPAIGEHEHVSGVTHDTKPHEKRGRIADVDGGLERTHALTVHL
jgi:hypothetical protein